MPRRYGPLPRTKKTKRKALQSHHPRALLTKGLKSQGLMFEESLAVDDFPRVRVKPLVGASICNEL